MLKKILVLLISALILSACGASGGIAPPAAAPGETLVASTSKLIGPDLGHAPGVGDVAPDFSYTLPDGSEHKLSDLRGRKVLVNFWATWCGPCEAELPNLQRASQTYSGDGLVVLGVNRQEEVDVITPYVAKKGLTFPVIANQSNDIGDGYGVRGLPTSFFINPDGTISFRQIGVVTDDFIKLRLEQMR